MTRAAAAGAAALALALALAGCGGADRQSGPPDLVFVSTRDGDYALFGATADGKDPYRLTKEKGDASSPQKLFFQVEPAWSPDGAEIAFTSGRDGVGHVFVMDATGKTTRRVTSTKQSDNHPSWSPDGKHLLFAREGALFTMSVAGGAATRVGKGPGAAANPTYSPDGQHIAFDYRRPGDAAREVYVMNADGTEIRRVTRLGVQSGLPAWSRDSRRIAFQSNAQDGHFDIYSIGADGTGLRRETVSTGDAIQPSWGPDGAALSFSRDGSIWVKDSTGERRLTPGEGNDSSPVWRPTKSGA
jgi:TolB protein